MSRTVILVYHLHKPIDNINRWACCGDVMCLVIINRLKMLNEYISNCTGLNEVWIYAF
jgi:hypothetical protein